MKLMISATLAAVMMVASSAQAATQNSQQGKMVTCNQQASGKTGDERATFMKHCLASGKSTHTRGHKKGSGTATHSTAHKKSPSHASATHHAATGAVTEGPTASTPAEQ